MENSAEEILQMFTYKHLPGHIQKISKPFCCLANVVAEELEGPYLVICLQNLLKAKDCAILAALST